MKKFLSILALVILIGNISYSQGNVDILVENPRIITDGGFDWFYFDVYTQKTSSWGDGTAGQQQLHSCSYYFWWNNTDCSNPELVYYDATVFTADAYNVSVATTGAGNLKLYIDVTMWNIPAAGYSWSLDEKRHSFTVRFRTNGSANLSNLIWNDVNDTQLTHRTVGFLSFVLSHTEFDSDCDIALDTKSWTGATNGDWDNGSNWSPSGVPSGVDIIYPNFPLPSGGSYYVHNDLSGIAVSPYGDIQNLRINHLAEMPIPQYCGITVSGTTTLMGGPRNLILQSGTGVNAPSSAYIPEGAINYSGYVIEDGHIEVHRTLYYTNTSANYYMHQVAAPVAGVILDDWDMIHFNTYAYEWDTGLQDWWNIYVPSRNTPPGYGFILSLWDIGAASTEDVVFYDNLVLTDVTPTFTISANEYALLGNPYTAPIDWDVLEPLQTNIHNEIHIWDQAAGYATYVRGTGGDASAQYIQPGQSFFVRASGAATQFNITTASRTQNIEPYLKEEPTNLLRIYTEGGNETWDKTYIRFKEGEDITAAYDNGHDGIEWPSAYGEFATEIYTVGSDDSKFSVDARPAITGEQQSVPLSFKPATEAEYKLHVDEESLTSFAPSIKIMLEDTFMPEMDWVDMRAEGNYTFNATPDDNLNRFILHFWDTEFGIEDGELAQPIKIYSDRTDAIILNDSEQLIKEILVYDITGNLIANKATVNNYSTRIYVSDEVGYYIVKVITDKAVYSEKVLITK